MNKKSNNKLTKGLSLIEIIIILLVLSISFATIFPVYIKHKNTKDKTQLEIIQIKQQITVQDAKIRTLEDKINKIEKNIW
jgi:competence protein ComGC